MNAYSILIDDEEDVPMYEVEYLDDYPINHVTKEAASQMPRCLNRISGGEMAMSLRLLVTGYDDGYRKHHD